MTGFTEIQREIDRGTRPELVRAWAVAALSDIAEGKRRLCAVRHPLGFTCLPVEREEGRGICVHAWQPSRAQPAPTTSLIHAHSWDLLSHVLHGRVRNEVVEVTETTVGADHRVYEIRSRGDVDEILATERLVRARSGAATTHRAGDSYALLAGRFHATEVDAGVAAVTVALGITVPTASDLSLGRVDGRSHRVQRRRCSEVETARVARKLIRLVALGSSGGWRSE